MRQSLWLAIIGLLIVGISAPLAVRGANPADNQDLERDQKLPGEHV